MTPIPLTKEPLSTHSNFILKLLKVAVHNLDISSVAFKTKNYGSKWMTPE